MIIQKYTETMTPRERVRRTFNLETTDRVTIGYETNPVIHAKLCEALGIPNNDYGYRRRQRCLLRQRHGRHSVRLPLSASALSWRPRSGRRP